MLLMVMVRRLFLVPLLHNDNFIDELMYWQQRGPQLIHVLILALRRR